MDYDYHKAIQWLRHKADLIACLAFGCLDKITQASPLASYLFMRIRQQAGESREPPVATTTPAPAHRRAEAARPGSPPAVVKLGIQQAKRLHSSPGSQRSTQEWASSWRPYQSSTNADEGAEGTEAGVCTHDTVGEMAAGVFGAVAHTTRTTHVSYATCNVGKQNARAEASEPPPACSPFSESRIMNAFRLLTTRKL